LTLDKEQQDDQVVEHKGAKVLLLGEEVRRALEGVTIDCEEKAEGPHLVVRRN
jgi:Fe-S cluster assembly iron-binding protein IscA